MGRLAAPAPPRNPACPRLSPTRPSGRPLPNAPRPRRCGPLLLPFPVGKGEGEGLPVENLAPATARGRRRNSVAPRLSPSPLRDKAGMRVAATPSVLSALTSHFSQLTPRLPLRVFRATTPGLRKGLLWAPRLWRHPWVGFLRASLAVLLRLDPFRPEPGLLPPATPGHCARRGRAPLLCTPQPRPSTRKIRPTPPRSPARPPLGVAPASERSPFIPHSRPAARRPFRRPGNPPWFAHPVNWARRAEPRPQSGHRRYHDA